MSNVIACSTHALALDTALFAGPVVTLALALWFVVRRERRLDAQETAASPEPARPQPA
jgi:cytochrome c-type biogenesis protein CcmH/NrfF